MNSVLHTGTLFLVKIKALEGAKYTWAEMGNQIEKVLAILYNGFSMMPNFQALFERVFEYVNQIDNY